MRVFENTVLRRTFGPKRDEVTGGWRKQQNVELHNLYPLPSIIRMIKLYCYFGYIISFNIELVNMSIFQIHKVYHSSAIILLLLIYY
jgi:hypothetical protein